MVKANEALGNSRVAHKARDVSPAWRDAADAADAAKKIKKKNHGNGDRTTMQVSRDVLYYVYRLFSSHIPTWDSDEWWWLVAREG